ncbi:CLUMA_CG013778, isoform A [Clunio marinus]|uniref:CLUMA_CG013778, isoform A n=1 Tax=Clunio marinus TaxID=568069 RepID=A0A1J1IJU4_9DIPT|nr:CLUMA_CG013778, isoform A [Clunio marinus]
MSFLSRSIIMNTFSTDSHHRVNSGSAFASPSTYSNTVIAFVIKNSCKIVKMFSLNGVITLDSTVGDEKKAF